MNKRELLKITLFSFLLVFLACKSENTTSPEQPDEKPISEIYTIPIVVHVLHLGEPIGEGTNLSDEQIESQIRVINEDYRKKENTRGFNNHPDGADSHIEFVLAKKDPEGNATNGIVRINVLESGKPIQFHNFEYMASLSYWNPEHYLNVWTEPFHDDLIGLILGQATGPITDLQGSGLFLKGEPDSREGISINAAHFGESSIPSDYNLGRTLTHEIGHYLGVLHPWGTRDCATNDFCDDTPAVDKAVGSTCGEAAMSENYMNYTTDSAMNIFTNDQVARMRYVLENSPYRKTLLTSPGLTD